MENSIRVLSVFSTDQVSLADIIVGSVSAFSCFLVVVVYFSFDDLRKLRYVELAFYVALSDMLGSIGLAIGSQNNYTFGCYFQSVITSIFFLSSAYWNMIITFQVYRVVVMKGKIIPDLTFYHLFGWGGPIFLSLIPLTTNTYGNDDDLGTWCYLLTSPSNPEWVTLVWYILTYYLWIWLAIILNISLLAIIFIKMRQMNIESAVINNTISKIVYYPIISTVCWIVCTVYDFCGITNTTCTNDGSVLSFVGNFMVLIQGLLSSILFFMNNPTIIKRIYYYYILSRNDTSIDKETDRLSKPEEQFDYISHDGNSFSNYISNFSKSIVSSRASFYRNSENSPRSSQSSLSYVENPIKSIAI